MNPMRQGRLLLWLVALWTVGCVPTVPPTSVPLPTPSATAVALVPTVAPSATATTLSTGTVATATFAAPTEAPTSTEAPTLAPMVTSTEIPTEIPTETPIPTPTVVPGSETFTVSILATGLNAPWEIAYGPDGWLWLTERLGRRVLHVNPADGTMQTLSTVTDALAESSQQGLLGLALHPELLQGTGNDFVYLAFTRPANAPNPLDRLITLRRYRYDPATQTLVEPLDLFSDLPSSNDHIGGRLTFGTDGKLYYAIGDRAANNLDNFCRPNEAQTPPTAEEIAAGDWQHYVGKILRINPDGSIPADNPTWAGVQSHVFSMGHRNPQGLVMGQGQLYATEHGPKTDDEVNRIVGGRNYGWPLIAGYQDDQAYVYANWSAASVPCATLTFSDYVLPDTVPRQPESAAVVANFMPPLYAFGTVSNGYNFQRAECDPNFYICWPTVAPSGIDFYAARGEGIASWGDSLLVAALKTGTIYRLPLNADGTALAGAPIPYFATINRYRDLAVAPDGRTFYVITDSSGATQGNDGLPTGELANPGAILVFRYGE